MRAAGAVLLLLLAVPACGRAGAPAEDARVVATLGDAQIPLVELAGLVRERAAGAELPRDGDGFPALRRRLLSERVIEELLVAEARERGIIVRAEELAAAVAERIGDPPDPDLVAGVVAWAGSEEAWRVAVERRLGARAAEAALRAELLADITVTDAQVDEALVRSPAVDRPARVRVRQIFDADPAAARAAHARLEAGEAFEAVAASLGQDPDLGWLSADAAPALVIDAVAALSPGQHTPVLRSPLGYHVLQLVARIPGGPVPAAEARASAEEAVRAEVVERRLEALLAERTRVLGLTVHEDVLDALRCCQNGAPFLAPPVEL